MFVKTFLVVLFLLMVPLAVVHYLVFAYNQSTMREEIGRVGKSELTRIRDTMEMIMNEAENLSIRLGSDSDIEALAKGNLMAYPLSYSAITHIRKIQDLLRVSTNTNPYIQNIYLYLGEKGYLLDDASAGTLDKYEAAWWFEEYQAKKSSSHFWISTLPFSFRQSGEDKTSVSFVLFRQLASAGQDTDNALIVHIGSRELEPLLQEMTAAQEIYIVDALDQIVYTRKAEWLRRSWHELHPDLSLPGKGETMSTVIDLQEGSHVISLVPGVRGDWRYISMIPLEWFETRQNSLRSFILLLIMIGIVSSLLIAFLVTIRSYRPIQSILSMLEQTEPPMKSLLDKNAPASNELKYIAMSIGQSYEKNKRLEEELQRRYQLMSRAQSVALQAQINPHMLYNTLEAVNWRVMRLTGGKNEASIMIHALSRMLRLSLSTGENIITLRRELEHARLYVEVQQLQFRDELNVIWQIDEEILDCPTVKLTLQPIIENAIHHGIRPARRPGIITISGTREENYVVLRIADNGIGIETSRAEEINRSFELEQIQEDEHIGLRNVNQRLRLIFGSGGGLHLSAGKAGGTVVKMIIPAGSSEEWQPMM